MTLVFKYTTTAMYRSKKTVYKGFGYQLLE